MYAQTELVYAHVGTDDDGGFCWTVSHQSSVLYVLGDWMLYYACNQERAPVVWVGILRRAAHVTEGYSGIVGNEVSLWTEVISIGCLAQCIYTTYLELHLAWTVLMATRHTAVENTDNL